MALVDVLNRFARGVSHKQVMSARTRPAYPPEAVDVIEGSSELVEPGHWRPLSRP
jgi:hypothetical protein